MVFQRDRIAKPLQHDPAPAEVSGHRKAADAVVEDWIEKLKVFFEASTQLSAGHPNTTRRTYHDALTAALDVVDHMKASVKSVVVDVFEVRTIFYW